jgi:alpha-L-fucosidase
MRSTPLTESVRTGHDWFDEAAMGLFVHWGIASVRGDTELSWGMIEDRPWDDREAVSAEEYWGLAEEFDPDSYVPDRWARAAREAGMSYAVLTARHHDGFSMWPTEYGEFGVAEHLNGRDLVGEFVDACRRQGIQVGLYYSPRDWHHPDYPGSPGPYEELPDEVPPTPEGMAERESYHRYVAGQVGELLTRYRPDLLWFDGYWPVETSGDAELYDIVRAADPEIVVNDRGGASILGDYRTYECDFPERPPGEPWEFCQIWTGGPGGTWGHVDGETYESLEWTVDQLARTVGWGGTLLLNVGPLSDGRLPDAARDRLEGLAGWHDANEPSVHGVTPGPWPSQCDRPMTRSDDGRVWYVHVLDRPTERLTVHNVPEPRTITVLRDGGVIPFEYDQTGPDSRGAIRVDLPLDDVEALNVLAITWDDPPRDEPTSLGRPR